MDPTIALFLVELTNNVKMLRILIVVNLEGKSSTAAPISGSLEAQQNKQTKDIF